MTAAELERIACEVRRHKRSRTRIGPSGLCFDWNLAVAAALARAGAKFKRGHFVTDTNGRWPHYWAELDGHIIDITSTQYNAWMRDKLPLVAVVPAPSPRYEEAEDESFRISSCNLAFELQDLQVASEEAT